MRIDLCVSCTFKEMILLKNEDIMQVAVHTIVHTIVKKLL